MFSTCSPGSSCPRSSPPSLSIQQSQPLSAVSTQYFHRLDSYTGGTKGICVRKEEAGKASRIRGGSLVEVGGVILP